MNERKNTQPSRTILKELQAMFEAGKNPLAYIPYAEALRAAGALNKALDACKTGLTQDSSSVTGRTLLARILYDMGRYDNALEELGNVLQLAQDAYGANLLMAKILAKKREYHDAYDIVNSLKSMNPTDPELLEIEDFLHSQIFSMETRGDLSDRRISSFKSCSIDSRINDLLKHLQDFSGVVRFSVSKLPQDNQDSMADADPGRRCFFQLSQIVKERQLGALKHVMLEMEKGSLLMFYLEGALLQIFTGKTVNLGKLRLQVEKILKP